MSSALSWTAWAAALIGTAASAATTLPGPAFPRFADPAAITAACDAGLAAAAIRVKALERHAPTRAGWPPGTISTRRSRTSSRRSGCSRASIPTSRGATRRRPAPSAGPSSARPSVRTSSLYRSLLKVKPRDAIEREFVKFAREGFEDSGVGLAPADRARAKQLSDRIADLGQQFEARIRDAGVKVPVAVEDLVGVPEDVWKTKPRDDAGKVLLGLDYSDPESGARARREGIHARAALARQDERRR